MCGIVGFTGNHQAAPILLDGLSKLEYRGYDSAGMAIVDETNGQVKITKLAVTLKKKIKIIKTEEQAYWLMIISLHC